MTFGRQDRPAVSMIVMAAELSETFAVRVAGDVSDGGKMASRFQLRKAASRARKTDTMSL